MLQFEKLRLALEKFRPDISDLVDALGLQGMKGEISQLDERATMPGLQDDMECSQKILQRSSMLRNEVANYEKLCSSLEGALALVELADKAEDFSLLPEAQQGYQKIQTEPEVIRLMTPLKGGYNVKNAISTFHAGTGGTEAQDWASILYRIYCHWAECHGFQVRALDHLGGEKTGLRNASILIGGINAYGFLKSETGAYRLVHVSPFDTSGRRHISFASLEIMSEIDSDTSMEISPDDIEMQVYRASGADRQKISKTSSAARLAHKPTGVTTSYQVKRSWYQNRGAAMKMLISKPVEIGEREHLEKIEDIKDDQKEIAWSGQIHSCVFMPCTLAEDHRTGFEMGNISAVMDGNLDDFTNAYLKAQNLDILGESIE